MDKFLGQEIPEKDRWQFLQDNADAVEEISWNSPNLKLFVLLH